MTTAAATAPRQSPVRTVFAGLIGNVLEWFDFGVYGFFASEIGKQFFADSDPTAQKLKAFAVFAIGFIGRPIGSIVLGRVGDRIGRRALLTVSIAIMGSATLLLGLIPTYASIGVAAPVLLVTLRFIQGFSLGGEFTGSMVYTTELASPRWRGLVSSSTAAGTTLGFILGSATAAIISAAMSAETVTSIGWRIPFVGSVVFCIAGWLLRRGIKESAEGEAAATLRAPLLASLVRDIVPIAQTFGIVAMTNAAYYVAFTFAVDRRKGESSTFLFINTISLVVVLISKPLGGWLSDYTGRRRLMMLINLAGMALIYPAVRLMLSGSPATFFLGQIMVGIPAGLALGLQGAMLVEIFPLRTRVTSMSFAYSVSLVLSGGIMPFVATWLLDVLKQPSAPAHDIGPGMLAVAGLIIVYGAVGLAVMLGMRETNARRLDV